jgi:tetratricopeptide (TPR) repeat protein
MVERSPGASEGASAQIQRQIAQLQDAVHNLEAVQMPAHTDTKQAPGEIDFYIGNALFRLDRPDEALASWESCATKSPNFALVKINLAVAYWKKGRFDEAKSLLAAAEAQGFPVNPHMKADLESAAAGAAPAPSPPPAPPGPSTTPPAPAPPSSSSPAAPSTPSPPSADGGA